MSAIILHFTSRIVADFLSRLGRTRGTSKLAKRNWCLTRLTQNFRNLLVPAILSLSIAQAADAVPWADLPKKIGRGKIRSGNREDRVYRVVTRAGMTYAGHELVFHPADVSVAPSGPAIPREQVAEIRIHRDGSLWDALSGSSQAVMGSACGADWCFPGPETLLLVPVSLAVLAVTAPFILPVEGVKRLLPDRVIRVAP